MPFGASLVIFTPLRRIGTGKCGLDIEVSHMRKSFVIAWLDARFSMIAWSRGSQLKARWQFYSSTHPPAEPTSAISCSAFAPYPLPSETGIIFRFRSSAYFFIAWNGSSPGDRMKISGLLFVVC
jgi:hypothetical protein